MSHISKGDTISPQKKDTGRHNFQPHIKTVTFSKNVSMLDSVFYILEALHVYLPHFEENGMYLMNYKVMYPKRDYPTLRFI